MKMRLNKFHLSGFALLFLLYSGVYARAGELYFIDAHSQVDQHIEMQEVVALMNKAGIRQTILAARGKRQSSDIVSLAQMHPRKFVAALRTKGAQYRDNTPRYYEQLANRANSGDYAAMAEVLIYHAQKGDLAPEVEVFPDDARVTAAFNAAQQHQWPFILHIEFSSLGGSQRQKHVDALEVFLKKHHDYPIALIHMGQLQADEVAQLIRQHDNLFFLTSHSNPIAVARSNQPWTNMFARNHLAPQWKQLVMEHPDRFIFALDNVWASHWRNGYKQQVDLWRNALRELPANVANAVAHGNAERLWHLSQ